MQDGNKTNTIHNLLFCSNSQLIFQPSRHRCNKESSSEGLRREHSPLLPYPSLCFGNSTGRERRVSSNKTRKREKLRQQSTRSCFINLLVQARKWSSEVKRSRLAAFQLFVLSSLTDCSHV